DLLHVTPVGRAVRLHKEQAARDKGAVNGGEEGGGDEAAVALGGVVVGLGVVAMDLRDAAGVHGPVQEFVGLADGKAEVCQPSLIGPAGRVANHHRQKVEAEMIVVRPPDRAAEEVAAVAATEVEYDRGTPPEEGLPIENCFGQLLEGGPGPLGRVQN